MSSERERLERLLGGEALRALRERARKRLATRAGSAHITFSGLTPVERRALEGLLGRRTRAADSLRVAVSELDEALRRAALASSFRAALELLDGPIPDTQTRRIEQAKAFEEVFAAVVEPRLSSFLRGAEARGLVKRVARAEPESARRLLEQVARLLKQLPAQGMPRSQFAAHWLGDAHGLDTARPVATILLSLLRSDDDESDRDVWSRVGVLVNELSAPALLLNVPAEPSTIVGRLAELARNAGEPVHLSLRSLLREATRWRVRGRSVFVCENPNLVAIAASQLGPLCAPLVCTDGMPSASQRVLLQQLAAQGALLRVHCDFDWPGLRIANFVMRSTGAQAWRMSAADYECTHGRALEGMAVDASWDRQLAAKMAAAGVALEEERVAEVLVADLRQLDG